MTHNTYEAIGRLVSRYRETQGSIAALRADILTKSQHMAILCDALSDDLRNVALTDQGYDVMVSGTGLPTVGPAHSIPYEFADDLKQLLTELRDHEKTKATLLECAEESGIASILRQ